MKISNLATFLTVLWCASCVHNSEEPGVDNVDEAPTEASKYLSSEEASILAQTYLEDLKESGYITRTTEDLQVSKVSLLSTYGVSRSEDPDTTFYIVDFEKGGYTLVAADRDIDNNIYVYSESGEFQLNDNPLMKTYLENAINALPYAPRKGSHAENKSITRAKYPEPNAPIFDEIEINGVKCRGYYKSNHGVKPPLLTTTWHQLSPYNVSCPKIDGQNAYVGCVAVAIGQICAYHRKPERFNGLFLDWDKMLKQNRHYSIFDSGLQEVADFLYQIGLKVNMDYGLQGSGATIDNALSGLKAMGFAEVKKKTFSTDDCVSSLRNDCPVYMRGSGDEGGHAWVVDGYDQVQSWVEYYRVDNGELYATYGGNSYVYLHFNAGWKNESKNTYYLCSGRDPDKNYEDFSVFGYTKGNQIILGIK